MKRILAVLAMVGMFCFGCENDNSTTVTESPDTVVNVPTNGAATVTSVGINGNANSTIVYVETSPGVTQVIDIDVLGNSNVLGVIYSQPAITPDSAPETPE